jgi:hypothetical protein
MSKLLKARSLTGTGAGDAAVNGIASLADDFVSRSCYEDLRGDRMSSRAKNESQSKSSRTSGFSRVLESR